MNAIARQTQRGGFVMGLVVGLLLGLALALGVALYVTKVPVPFVNKVNQRTAEQDAAEIEKNKNWDPNGPLQAKPGARPGVIGGAVGLPAVPPPPGTPGVVAAPVGGPALAASAPAVAGRTGADAAASAVVAKVAPPPASTKPGVDPFTYLVQAGAYARTEDAEQQRAKLAMLGYEARLTEREQSGRTMYRVRIGPFDKKTDAEAAREKLTGAGVDAAVVTVQK
jgi:cell division protein FtsN